MAPTIQQPQDDSTGASIPDLQTRIPKLERRKKRAPPSNPDPPPKTPALPPAPALSSSITFRSPIRRILSAKDHELFLESPTYQLILAWIFGLADAVVDTPISAVKDEDLSPVVKTLLQILDEAEQLCEDSPPDDQAGSRFGNKAFRVFLDKVKRQSTSNWHPKLLGAGMVATTDVPAAAASEVATYLHQSFGNRRRIDYGSGHELNFAVWLLCLDRLGLLSTADRPALVLRVFARYLRAMRRVQLTYYLEPAGSHGVWGLDDYQFLPFLWGAAQLLHHRYLTPRAIHQELVLEQFAPDYLYLGQVAFVNATKTVKGLRWHSPMLDDISGARDWAKVAGGMRKMFVAEVLRKLPVMQHFLFGGLVPAAEGMSEPLPPPAGQAEDDGDGDGDGDGDVDVFDDPEGKRHVHSAPGWGDCCGIKVPSSLAASEEMRKKGLGGQLRRIPFD
ncbi:hypothetical protein P8C59_006969 [Phyllachora maydis]|uniref:Serine/threonine-protein phosphatase 2A activator n=1 Tax=Phyllachora maydis TaxID=1825666 RepID=A0AAD9I7X1_9PEZI|nr:hypothetical protein P8C59_006969 [Phyllachora maydis]